MSPRPQTTIRRLGPDDEAVVERLAAPEAPHTALLADDRTVFVAAFDGDEPVGFAFGYLLPRRRREPTIFFVYEVDVAEGHRRRGIGKRLLEELLAGQGRAFVLADADNVAANALYGSVGGTPHHGVVEWNF